MYNTDLLIQLLKGNSYTTNKEGVEETIQMFMQSLPVGAFDEEKTTHDKFADFRTLRSKQWDEKLPRIAIMLHADTVYAPDMDFPVRQDGSYLYGPGACDMKSSLVAVAEVLIELAAINQLKNIILIINTCEEKGSPAFQDQMRKIASEVTHVIGFEKADDGNLPADDPGYAREFVLASARKGIFQQTISVKGPGGHSGALSRKSERKNAVSHAIAMMNAIDGLADYDKGTTINLAFVKGGRKNTVIAEDCEFTFDCRFESNEEVLRVKNEVARILQEPFVDGIEVIDKGYSFDLPSFENNSRTEGFLTQVQSIASDLDITVSGRLRGGWSDVCNLYAYNQELTILDGFGPKGGDEHSTDEHVRIDSIETSIKLASSVISALLSNG